jgi:16S rRNA (cytidine1402-2'-O)-methyltransferase
MLHLVATPIGNNQEITLRALEVLRTVTHVICESTREASTLLKAHGISGKIYYLLNEHTTPEELRELLEVCKNFPTALISDCGTPGFCDPGPSLIRLCRSQNIPIKSILGASSLMGLLSLASEKFNQFLFVGFLPAEKEQRELALRNLKKETKAMIFMDTPYRQKKLLSELAHSFPQRRALLVQNLSQENEDQIEGSIEAILKRIRNEKAEFMLLLYPFDPNYPMDPNYPFDPKFPLHQKPPPARNQ